MAGCVGAEAGGFVAVSRADGELAKRALLRLQRRVVGAKDLLERWRETARVDQRPMIDKVLGLLEADADAADPTS